MTNLGTILNSAIAPLIRKQEEVIIMPGDFVKYWCEDDKCEKVGIYVDLWYYISNETETSPFPENDALCEWRTCTKPIYHAYINSGTPNAQRATYANISNIELASEIDWMRYHFGTSAKAVA